MKTRIEHKELNKVDAYRAAREELKKRYETESGKKLVHHLITSFNSEKPKLIIFSKSDLWDCLSGSILRPVFTKDVTVPDEILELIDKSKSEDDKELANQIQTDLTEVLEKYLKENNIGRYAYRATNSNKIIGIDELRALSDFITDQIDQHNMTIFSIMNHINPKKFPWRSFNKVKDDNLEAKLKALKEKFNSKSK